MDYKKPVRCAGGNVELCKACEYEDVCVLVAQNKQALAERIKKEILDASLKELVSQGNGLLECADCEHACRLCVGCADCQRCYLCVECVECADCVYSYGLRDAQYVIANIQFSEQEYEAWIEQNRQAML